jgi:hypothetical protein
MKRQSFIVRVFRDGFLLFRQPRLHRDLGLLRLLLVVCTELVRDIHVDCLTRRCELRDAQTWRRLVVVRRPRWQFASPRYQLENLAPIDTRTFFRNRVLAAHQTFTVLGRDVACKDVLEPVKKTACNRAISCRHRKGPVRVDDRVVVVQNILDRPEQSSYIVALGPACRRRHVLRVCRDRRSINGC